MVYIKKIYEYKGKVGVMVAFIICILIVLISIMKCFFSNFQYYYKDIIYSNIPIVQYDSNNNKVTTNNVFVDMIIRGSATPFYIISNEIPIFKEFYIENKYVKYDSKNEYSILDNYIERNSINPDKKESIPKNLIGKLDPAHPRVLIYHSHTTEAYKPAEPDTTDDNMNVCAVGEKIKDELQNYYGISAINDTTVNNRQYLKSYVRSGEVLDRYLQKYGKFDLIIDLHRDSGNSREPFLLNINGKDYAKVMFVMTKKNPLFNENHKVVTSLTNISDKLYPGLSRGIMYYNYGTDFFNQNKSPNAVLLEVGSDKSLISDATSTSDLMARVIAEYLNGNK